MSKINVTAPQVAYAMSILEQFPDSMTVRKDHYGALAIAAAKGGWLNDRELGNIRIYMDKLTLRQLVELYGVLEGMYIGEEEGKAESRKELQECILRELMAQQAEPDVYASLTDKGELFCPICQEPNEDVATRVVCKRCGASIEVCVDGDED